MFEFFIFNQYYIYFIFLAILIFVFYLFSRRKLNKSYNKKLESEVNKQLLLLRQKDELLIAQSKLAAVGETLSHIAHQWKQPLNQINSVVLNIEEDFEEKKLNKKLLENHLNEIEKLTFYMADTITSFNTYLQPNDKKEVFSVKEALNNALELVDKLLESKKIKCKLSIKEDSLIKGVKNEFIQALLVILHNAKDVLEERQIHTKKIAIKIYVKNIKAYIEIEDNAGGIKDKDFDKIFDPYFTTKTHSQGTGHGLCMAKMIIEKSMNGKLNVKNEKKGAKFCISLAKELK